MSALLKANWNYPTTIWADPGRIAETGHLLQRCLRPGGQTRQLPDHEIRHVVGVALGANAPELPGPARMRMVESEQPLSSERGNELDDEKWIAGGLHMHQLRQRCGAIRLAA